MNRQVGELAVYDVIISVASFLNILIEEAMQNLEHENNLRKEKGLELRKTLQDIDIKMAKIATLINITRDSLISKYQYRSGE